MAGMKQNIPEMPSTLSIGSVRNSGDASVIAVTKQGELINLYAMFRSAIIGLTLACSLGSAQADDSLVTLLTDHWKGGDHSVLEGGVGEFRFEGGNGAVYDGGPKLSEAIRDTEAFTVAFRFLTEDLEQKGPARNFSI